MKIIDINNQERECQKVYLDPHWPGYVTVLFVSKNRPGYKHTEWMPSTQFFANNPSLVGKITADELPPALPPQIAGTVTSSTPKSVTDKTAKWKANLYAGFFVWISRGKGEGQVRTILKNSAKVITVDKPWDTKPDKTSQYSVVHNPPTTKASGNSLLTASMADLEKKARQMDIDRGREPAEKQYTN